MPTILNHQNIHCAISGKLIHKEDYVVVIPAFPIHPEDPDSFFSDNIALRDEFEKWPLKDKIIAKAQEVWLKDHRSRKSQKILVDNEYFLVTKNLKEDRISLTFLNHVFGVGTKTIVWTKLCQQVTTLEKNEFVLSPSEKIFWDTTPSYVVLIREIRNGSRDRIKIPMAEWLSLKEILAREQVMHP